MLDLTQVYFFKDRGNTAGLRAVASEPEESEVFITMATGRLIILKMNMP